MDKSVRTILEKLQESYHFTPTGEHPEGEVLLDGDAVNQALSDIKKLLPKSKLGLIANREIGYSDGWNAYKKEIERILDV